MIYALLLAATVALTPTPPPHTCGVGPVRVRVERDGACMERTDKVDTYRYTSSGLPNRYVMCDVPGCPTPCVRPVYRWEQWTDWPECGGEPLLTPQAE